MNPDPQCPPDLHYTRIKLDRADSMRSDESIETIWQSAGCRILPMYKNKSLYTDALDPVVANRQQLSGDYIDIEDKTFLGIDDNDHYYFSVRCSDEDALQWRHAYPQSEFLDLRQTGPSIDRDMASVLAYARGLAHWQSVSNFCSKCGGRNQLISAGHAMRCENCSSQLFPRTDPAVIMLVEHLDEHGTARCLLGRSPSWPEGCFSTLAGFVETGETLEAAVIREVFEEAGILVENPVYVASQPWPFPQSIMLGFAATAKNAEIKLDQQELAHADWFSAEEILQFGEWADEGSGMKLPRVDSIARHLIDGWVAKQCKTSTGSG